MNGEPETIRKAVERVAASRVFRQSERMCRFLRFVVEHALRDDLGQLKEAAIGVNVFDRDPAYDPKSDPIVRVEARRLRRKLQQYYESEGVEEQLRIEVPKGHYAPQFQLRENNPEPEPLLAYQPMLPPQPVRSYRWLAWTGMGLAILAACGSVILWHEARRGQPIADTALAPITSYVGNEFDAAVSPDGRQVAFVWDGDRDNYDIYVKLTDVGSAVRLTTDTAHDLHPAWSPDGRYLAFLRVSRDRQDVIVIPSLGGPERRVTSIASEVAAWRADATQMSGMPGPAWSPDGKWLAVTDHVGTGGAYGLFLVPLGGGARRQVTFPAGSANDFYPAFSLDGRYLAFARMTSNSSSDVYFVRLSDGKQRQLTHDQRDVRGLAWMPDSRSLVLSSNRSGPHALWLLGLDGELRLVPTNAQTATQPAAARDGWIAYTNAVQNTNIWLRRGPASRMVIGSSSRNNSPQLSPDGSRIAFVSDRSGSWEIWTASADGSHPVELTHFSGPMVGTPHWSQDMKWIAFDARPEGLAAVFIIPAEGGVPRRLNTNAYEERMPNWSNDGQWIYFNSNRAGTVQLWKAHPDGSNPVRLTNRVAYDSGESPDGRYVYFLSSGPGIWRALSTGGEETLLPALSEAYPRRYWAVTRRGIYYLARETAPRAIHFYDFATGGTEQVGQIDGRILADTPSLSASPDGRDILYAQEDQRGSDISRLAIDRSR
jgi:Tol biopolymer transport system component